MTNLDLKNKPSFLWKDSDYLNDYNLIYFLVDKIVVGDKKHKEFCTEKILAKLQEKIWQEKYSSYNFIFLMQEYFINSKILDINFIMACQVLENMYFYTFDDDPNFGTKVKNFYNLFFKGQFRKDSKNIIRILRNNVAHSGLIEGVPNKLPRELDDINEIKKFLSLEKAGLRALAFETSYLIENIFIRIIGLEDEDLSRNGRPPEYSILFRVN